MFNKKIITLLSVLIIATGCAKTMTIDSRLLEGDTAKIKVAAPELKGYVSVPLMNHKFVGIKLFDKASACQDLDYGTGKGFGKARLTPSSHTQEFEIPASKPLYVTTRVEENFGGTITACNSAFMFTPENNKFYLLEVVPQKVFGTGCKVRVTESDPSSNSSSAPMGLEWFNVKWTGEAKVTKGCATEDG